MMEAVIIIMMAAIIILMMAVVNINMIGCIIPTYGSGGGNYIYDGGVNHNYNREPPWFNEGQDPPVLHDTFCGSSCGFCYQYSVPLVKHPLKSK